MKDTLPALIAKKKARTRRAFRNLKRKQFLNLKRVAECVQKRNRIVVSSSLDSRHAFVNAGTDDFKNDTARTTSFGSLICRINRIRNAATKHLRGRRTQRVAHSFHKACPNAQYAQAAYSHRGGTSSVSALTILDRGFVAIAKFDIFDATLRVYSSVPNRHTAWFSSTSAARANPMYARSSI